MSDVEKAQALLVSTLKEHFPAMYRDECKERFVAAWLAIAPDAANETPEAFQETAEIAQALAAAALVGKSMAEIAATKLRAMAKGDA